VSQAFEREALGLLDDLEQTSASCEWEIHISAARMPCFTIMLTAPDGI
jgi:hypothetical protein